MSIHARRGAIILGVAASLLLGAVSIRAAAAWTAAAAPLAVSPTSAGTLANQLVNEQARSAALQAQLQDLAARASELSTALAAAQGRIATDASSAARLRTRLVASQKKLDALQRSLRAAAARSRPVVVATAVSTAAPAGPTAGGNGGDDD